MSEPNETTPAPATVTLPVEVASRLAYAAGHHLQRIRGAGANPKEVTETRNAIDAATPLINKAALAAYAAKTQEETP